MRLFLASSLFGNHGDRLTAMTGAGARVAIISNALDNLPDLKREYMRDVVSPLFARHRFRAEEYDLRRFFGRSDEIRETLCGYDLVWAIGGNSFLLRQAMRLSAFDRHIASLLASSEVTYGGWSAGTVVAGTDLNGIHLMDDADATAPGYSPLPDWSGLGLVEGTIVPHFASEHPEADAAAAAASYLEGAGGRVITLREGEVLLIDSGWESILPA